jgi:Xaa-Pro aminopeptidase
MARSRTTSPARALASRRSKAFKAFVKQTPGEAVLVSRPEDVSYLSGFTGEDSYLLMGKDWAVLITDGRFTEQAANECAGLDVFTRSSPVPKVVAERMKDAKARRLVVQGDHMTLRGSDMLAGQVGKGRVAHASDVVIGLRATKDDSELASIRKAIKAAETAFRQLMAGGAGAFVGKTERQIAAELEHRMRDAGASGPSFDTIVAAGPHGSLPHYRAGARKIRSGEAVLIDWGAKVEGYCSDLTRVVFMNTIPPKLGEIYDLVLQAQKAGIAAVKAGVSGARPDEAARKVIADGGYGKQFMHSLGHGIGLVVHELPVLAGRAKGRLRSGQVVTVEPGIYLPGEGGVRIEDDVLVTAQGAKRLTSLPREIKTMVLR